MNCSCITISQKTGAWRENVQRQQCIGDDDEKEGSEKNNERIKKCKTEDLVLTARARFVEEEVKWAGGQSRRRDNPGTCLRINELPCRFPNKPKYAKPGGRTEEKFK